MRCYSIRIFDIVSLFVVQLLRRFPHPPRCRGEEEVGRCPRAVSIFNDHCIVPKRRTTNASDTRRVEASGSPGLEGGECARLFQNLKSPRKNYRLELCNRTPTTKMAQTHRTGVPTCSSPIDLQENDVTQFQDSRTTAINNSPCRTWSSNRTGRVATVRMATIARSMRTGITWRQFGPASTRRRCGRDKDNRAVRFVRRL